MKKIHEEGKEDEEAERGKEEKEREKKGGEQ